jgi:hypothetical protein
VIEVVMEDAIRVPGAAVFPLNAGKLHIQYRNPSCQGAVFVNQESTAIVL